MAGAINPERGVRDYRGQRSEVDSQRQSAQRRGKREPRDRARARGRGVAGGGAWCVAVTVGGRGPRRGAPARRAVRRPPVA